MPFGAGGGRGTGSGAGGAGPPLSSLCDLCSWARLRWAPKMATRTSTVAMASTHQVPQMIFSVSISGPRPALQSPMIHNSTEARKAAPNSDTNTTVMVKLADGDLNHAGGLTPSDHARISAFGHSLGCGRRKCQPNIVT